jgi:site-specific DNA recombinase
MTSLSQKPSDSSSMINCAIYTRVSTDSQADVAFNSCEAQEDRIRSFIDSQQGFVVAKVYSDPGYSGANLNRPALRQMLADIQAGHINMVITYKIDRLTRSPRDFYELIDLFEKNGASFISVTERFDTSTPSGRLLRNIMLTFGQFERELASERVKDKVIQRVNRGLYHGGHPPFGYKAENAALVLDPPRDATVKKIFEMYVESRSIRKIARWLREKKVFSRKGKSFCDSTIWNVLRKEVYTGKVVHKGKVFPGKHPAIVSEELFNHVQRLIKETPRFHTESHDQLPFAGIVRCGECGSVMSVAYTDKKAKTGKKRYYYYRCTKVNNEGWAACSTQQVSAERLHESAYNNLLRVSMDADYLKNLVFSMKNKTLRPGANYVEPPAHFEAFTPEKLEKSLKAFMKGSARKTGIEKALFVRQGIEQVHYSKKTIRLDFVVDWKTSDSSVDDSRMERGPSAPVLDSDASVPTAALPPAPKSKEPNRLSRLGPDVKFVSRKMAAQLKTFQLWSRWTSRI